MIKQLINFSVQTQRTPDTLYQQLGKNGLKIYLTGVIPSFALGATAGDYNTAGPYPKLIPNPVGQT